MILKIGKRMISVLSSGVYTSIQDFGRVGNAHFGVSKAGVMDENAAKWGNYLLQNALDAAVLELTFGGCKLAFLTDTYVCITGADFSATLNGETISLYKPIAVKAHSILSFGKRKFGVRTYIAVIGGFKTPSILGSRSYFKGITQNATIQKGDILPIENHNCSYKMTNSSVRIDTSYFTQKTILCTPAPEFDLLSEQQKAFLTSSTFTISTNNSRMGYQLNELIANDFPSMLTSAVLTGTVQLTPSGKLIVLMRDCQVTGGYPRVLQLTEAAINSLAQKTTGDGFQFILKL